MWNGDIRLEQRSTWSDLVLEATKNLGADVKPVVLKKKRRTGDIYS